MNPLVEDAHLFLNGEFDAYYKGDAYRINGYRPHNRGIELRNEYNIYPAIQNCTLIARSIMDMTEKEINQFADIVHGGDSIGTLANPEDAKVGLAMRLGTDELTFREFEFLNSNGFYHGSQAHFEQGLVIEKI